MSAGEQCHPDYTFFISCKSFCVKFHFPFSPFPLLYPLAPVPGAGRRAKKKKIDVYLNAHQFDPLHLLPPQLCCNPGTKYEYKMKCTLCTAELAVFFCRECSLDEKTREPKERPEFYCKGCNVTMHRTEKRKGHIVSVLRKLSLKVAAKLVAFAVRYHVGVLNLQKRARLYIRRFFDTKTLCHYYWNSKNGETLWRKPYCLRKEELFPFLTV